MSVKRKPVFCNCCSMDITNAVRIRCAQLGPQQKEHGTPVLHSDEPVDVHSESAAATRKHEPVDALHAGPRSDGLVPVCDEFDICGSCFCEGKEVGKHKRWHDYRVVTQHAYPIFTNDWGADEWARSTQELLLVNACQTFGVGNWADIAEHIGSFRTKEEVEDHYLATYIESPLFPLPRTDITLVDQETFQSQKKARLEDAQQRPVPIPPPKPLASAPTCHEIAGFMPGRLEFETEWENDAEALIKDMEFGLVHRYGGDDQPTREQALGQTSAQIQEDSAAQDSRQPQAAAPSNRGLGGSAGTGTGPNAAGATGEDAAVLANGDATAASANQTAAKGKDSDDAAKADEKTDDAIKIWDETDDDLELKLTIMEIYNERIQRRLDAKNLIFDRGLLDYKRIAAAEKKKPREERDLVNRMKVFARLQTSQDHEEFINGLLYEQALRKHIADLQEYRQAGLTSLSEVDKYEKDKSQRIAIRGGAHTYRDAMFSSSRNVYNRNASRESTPNPRSTGPTPSRKAQVSQQLTLANAASLQLLTEDEVKLCSELHILPKPFLVIKQSLLREFARLGGRLERDYATELLSKVDSATVGKVWDFLFGAPHGVDVEEDAEMLAAALDEDSDSDDEEEEEEQERNGNNEEEETESSSEEDEGDLMGELQEAMAQQQQMQLDQDMANDGSTDEE